MKLALGSHGLVELHAVIHPTIIRVSITRSRRYSIRKAKCFKLPNTPYHLQKIKKLCQKISGQEKITMRLDWKDYDHLATYQGVQYNNSTSKIGSLFAYRIFIPKTTISRTVPYDVYYH